MPSLIDLHVVTVEDEPLNAKYVYRAQCKCGWQARVYTVKEAEDAGTRHLQNQGILCETEGIRSGGLGAR